MRDSHCDISEINAVADAADTADELQQDVLDDVMRAYRERLEYELRGAWQAGYDWLHVFEPVGPTGPPDETPMFTRWVLPAISKRPPTPDDARYVCSYDLRSVDAADVRVALGASE